MIDVNAYLGHFAFRQLRHNTADGLLRLMDRAGIERAAVSSASAIAYRNPQAGNEEVAEQVKPHRDRLIPFAVLNPMYAGWEDDLKICHQEFGVRGLRLYPHWHRYRLADRACIGLVNAATDLGLAVSIPRRVEDRRQSTWLVEIPDVDTDEIVPLIKACPRSKFILGNGSGFVGSPLGRSNNGLPANYSIEISLLSALLGNEIGQLVRNLGEDRILFGTGIPFHYPGPAVAKVEVLDVPNGVKEKIRSGNAARLLGLS